VNARPAGGRRKAAVRWLVPALVLATLGATLGEVIASSSSGGARSLPVLSADELLGQVKAARPASFSGTVVAQLSDGAEALQGVAALEVLAAGTPPAALGGAHTVRVWYGGPTQQRVALVGANAETDFFRSGEQVWQWSSADRIAVHSTAPSTVDAGGPAWSVTALLTPVSLAHVLLSAADSPLTDVSLAETVADRSVYGMVLRPKEPNSLVDYVHIAVDGATKTPLGVQVYARGAASPAVDVSFTDIRYAAQPASMFNFDPPEDATVTTGAEPRATTVTRYGTGWTSVLCYSGSAVTPQELAANEVLAIAPDVVKGDWGEGTLLKSALVSALVTTDGRVFVGAVAPSELYAAAAR
jgi:outer membrane lipoprotein-sorting protein